MKYKNTTKFEIYFAFAGNLKAVAPGEVIDIPEVDIQGLIPLNKKVKKEAPVATKKKSPPRKRKVVSKKEVAPIEESLSVSGGQLL